MTKIVMKESALNVAILKTMDNLLAEAAWEKCNPKKCFKEVRYFSRNGKGMPNGVGFQRGGFLHECKINAESFVLNEKVHDNQYGLSDYRGGIIVFSTDVNAVKLDQNSIINKVKQLIATFSQRYNASAKLHKVVNKFNRYNTTNDYIGAYSVGNAFRGKYVGDNGEEYNESSTTIEVNGLSSKGLLWLAEFIARSFHQETVLVKDFNTMKFYLANGLRSTDGLDLGNINAKC